MDIATIPLILPSFLPIQIQQVQEGYFKTPLEVEGERHLTESELGRVISASSFVGTQLHCMEQGFDREETRQKLADSLHQIPAIPPEDREAVLSLVERFHSYLFEPTMPTMIGSPNPGGPGFNPATMNIPRPSPGQSITDWLLSRPFKYSGFFLKGIPDAFHLFDLLTPGVILYLVAA